MENNEKNKTEKIQIYLDKNLYNKIVAESNKLDLKPSVYSRMILNKSLSEVRVA